MTLQGISKCTRQQHGQHLEVAIENVYEARYPAGTTIGEMFNNETKQAHDYFNRKAEPSGMYGLAFYHRCSVEGNITLMAILP